MLLISIIFGNYIIVLIADAVHLYAQKKSISSKLNNYLHISKCNWQKFGLNVNCFGKCFAKSTKLGASI